MHYRVRAAYTTLKQAYNVDPVFLNSHEPPAPASAGSQSKFPPIFRITPDAFVLSFLPSELGKIDNLLAHKKRTITVDVRARVLGSKDDRPEVSQAWKHKMRDSVPSPKNSRIKTPCSTPSYSPSLQRLYLDLQVFSRCKLVHYCGREWSFILIIQTERCVVNGLHGQITRLSARKHECLKPRSCLVLVSQNFLDRATA